MGWKLPKMGTACYILPLAEGSSSSSKGLKSFPFPPQGCSSKEFISTETFEGGEGGGDMDKESSVLSVIISFLPLSYSPSFLFMGCSCPFSLSFIPPLLHFHNSPIRT